MSAQSAQTASAKLLAIKWQRPHLSILNQLLLPHASEYIDIKTSADGHHAIVSMQTRGAPAIAIVAALSLAAEVSQQQFDTAQQAYDFIMGKLDYLATSRPTAVNLFDAITKLKRAIKISLDSQEDVAVAYVDAAEAMLATDVADNQSIGLQRAVDKIKVLTHCNTGALATAGHGTALGIIRSLYQKPESILEHVYFGETRPYNQGARLTAYELLCEEIPSTLVCDSAVSALLRSDPTIVAIIVGADRLAITAKFHGRAFIVAAPTTSIDLAVASGKGIVIEERDPNEITAASGFVQTSLEAGKLVRETLCVAPKGTAAWNPSFDVTPAELITAIVTEKGVFVKGQGATEYDLAASI
ncbi:methylthioribose-1-phosphate isomerase-like protein [Kickxella alabastrina]|uniref:methylthioribose-1-phosphate isomerase-like protein n=1 Tax=Kickxella alabastrina TaxID=61397 RepID=UPI0022212A92|nr:methylthioribose-1-phosphate isomerase-like protein [Kickxella alabastrina]KAI7827710.1 methylthioribose-1-phosphate isomerase-like protein [Kickxella alabastrina]